MQISDSAITTKVQAQLSSESQQIKKTNSAPSSDHATTEADKAQLQFSPAVALELSDTAKESLKLIDPIQQETVVAESQLSDEAKDALKQIAQTMFNDTSEPSAAEEALASPLAEDQNAQAIDSSEEAADSEGIEESKKTPSGKELKEEDFKEIESLKKRDAAVRAHETAHATAGGGLTGTPTYEYQSGPDGKRYAVGGHVSIDTSRAKTPEETIAKASKIRAAALAPADPSPADRAIAAGASQMEAEARSELIEKKQQEAEKALESLGESQSEAAEAADEATPSGQVAEDESLIAGQDNETTSLAASFNPGGESSDDNTFTIPKINLNQPIPISTTGLAGEQTTANEQTKTTDRSNLVMSSSNGSRRILNESNIQNNLSLMQNGNTTK